MTEQPEPAATAVDPAARLRAVVEAALARTAAHGDLDAQAEAVLDAIARCGLPGSDGGHVYLSTGCLHGDHGYCQAGTGAAGAKIPARCKFCETPCICRCHHDRRTPMTTPEAADLAALRNRIADALLAHLSRTADIRPGRDGDLAFMPEVTDSERLRLADVVLAVLPPPVDRATVAYRSPGTRALYCVTCARQETGWLPVAANAAGDGGRTVTAAAGSPAQLLHRAASLLRAVQDYLDGGVALLPEGITETQYERASEMSPVVRPLLADWLDGAAELHEEKLPGHANVVPPGCQWCGDEDWPCADMRHALTLARQLLGDEGAQR